MAEFRYDLKIPKERVAVLIGKHGEIKKRLEQESGCNIDVDSKEGDVIITGDDAIRLYTVREVIRAVSRGFNPDVALRLLKQDYLFEVISLNDIARHKNDMLRLKGRVIGSEGKARRNIESLTECTISVYGKTIGMIGPAESIGLARRAVEQILKGSTHSSVYKWLEKKHAEMKRQEILGKKAELRK
ncbi:MAG: KH domain-containing protein [Nanoarchaeota archaeon]|nr:KH domain-containing protein [Nanoarchaeota archaeon]